MKVAIVAEHVDPGRGGAETSTLEMARRLGELGLDVTVVCAGSGGESAAVDSDHETPYTIHRIPMGSAGRAQRAIHFVSEVDLYCRQTGFDIVHAVSPCFSCNVYQPRGGTYVETVKRSAVAAGWGPFTWLRRLGRRFNQRQRFLLLVEREMLNDANPPFVAAVSEYVRRQVLEEFPEFPQERAVVVFNGVEPESPTETLAAESRRYIRTKLKIGDETKLILFVAHNFKLKGLAELLRACRELSRTGSAGEPVDWSLAIVGRDSPGRFQKLASSLGIAERVYFVGAASDAREYYAEADVLAHPTWYDPCSRVVLEAITRGVPVVTTRLNGAAEVIDSEQVGSIVDSPTDVAALASAIRAQLAIGRGRSIAEGIRERVSMARHARQLKDMYTTVLAASGASSIRT